MINALMAVVVIFMFILLDYKKLLNAKPRGKVMKIYFILIGISVVLGILISIDKRPVSPNDIINEMLKSIGVE